MSEPVKSTVTAETLQPGAPGAAAPATPDDAPAARGERAALTRIPQLAGWLGIATATLAIATVLFWQDTVTVLGASFPFGAICLGGTLGVGAAALLLRLVVAPAIEQPASELAAVAEAVAAGNLTVRVADARGVGHLARLSRAVARMLVALRKLAGAMRGASHETAALAQQITASSEHMALRAQDTAQTSAELTRRARDMAEGIADVAAEARRLDQIAADLSTGARAGVERNRALHTLAAENRERLDAGAEALGRLEHEVHQTAQAVEALADASEEIRAFVTLVQKLARQSRLLSLNAAMEAARAGEHGDGFAVVATEVRRLAATSGEAAGRTEALVRGVLERLEHSRVSTTRAVETVDEVLGATRQASESFARVEGAVAENEGLQDAVESAAMSASTLAGTMSARLATLDIETQGFAAAVRQVAAVSEEQSASAQEVAGAAAALTQAAEHLAALVHTFQLEDRSTERIGFGVAAAARRAARRAAEAGEGQPAPAGGGSGTQPVLPSPVLTSA